MTRDDAIRLAQAKAQKLGFPWDPQTTLATRRRLWPFPATWRVVSQVTSPRARTTMRVSERKNAAFPAGVLYPAAARALRRPLGPHLVRRLVVPALLGAGLAFLVASAILGWPLWGALLVAGGWAIITPILAASIRHERAVDLNEK